jgi:hypothetical protein
VLVGLDPRDEPELGRIDTEPGEQRIREQHVGPRCRHAVLQEPVGEDHVDARHLGAAPDGMPEEPAVVGDDLESRRSMLRHAPHEHDSSAAS